MKKDEDMRLNAKEFLIILLIAIILAPILYSIIFAPPFWWLF